MPAEERWLPAVGFEGFYDVSDHGRVKSLRRVIVRTDGTALPIVERILKPGSLATGHQIVNLHTGGKPRGVLVHRLVLEAFVGPCPDGCEGCHGDGNPRNNTVGNLRWDTRSMNMKDRTRHGGDKNANKTHCVLGHAFDSDNTYFTAAGYRGCKACRRMRTALNLVTSPRPRKKGDAARGFRTLRELGLSDAQLASRLSIPIDALLTWEQQATEVAA